MGKHLKRLDRIFTQAPIYFITVTSFQRRRILSTKQMQNICEEVWANILPIHHWSVGPYVIMPDHLHFFFRVTSDEASDLSLTIGKWKEWTAKYATQRLGIEPPLWQPEFFDHLLRSKTSLREKIEYVWQNPVRAGLVDSPEDWQFKGNPGDWGVL
tara:strand:+ start:56 stop:523 length:468 start_codon:yes stop_codon:yes gene_type:complete